jgi:hypothetical protein
MALINYATVYAGAGFAGESFNICEGYNLSFVSPTTASFVVAGNTINLTTGAFPAWLQEVGKQFTISGTANNNGVFTVAAASGTVINTVEAIALESAILTNFDGSGCTAIIDQLLSLGNGVLTEDCPFDLISTGTLFGPVTLDLARLEKETTDQGGMAMNGRPLFLHVLNSNVSSTNTITISSSTPGTINGASTFVINNTGDYMLMHVAAGLWRVCILPKPGEGLATFKRVPFTAAMWNAGATKNKITVIASGSLSAGQAGPHNLTIYEGYNVDIINTDIDGTDSTSEMVNVEVKFDAATGNIILLKAEKAKPFNGIALIVGSMD